MHPLQNPPLCSSTDFWVDHKKPLLQEHSIHFSLTVKYLYTLFSAQYFCAPALSPAPHNIGVEAGVGKCEEFKYQRDLYFFNSQKIKALKI